MDLEALDRRLAEIHAGHRWIVPVDAAAGATLVAKTLRRWGAEDVLVVAAVSGVGDLPTEAEIHYVDIPTAASLMDGIRLFEGALRRPDRALQAAVDRFDPDGRAIVMATLFEVGTELLGRRMYGARRPEWAALEDKTVVDRLWDSVGVPRAPSVVVPVADAPDAADDLAGPMGTVWAADNSRGWHGGADGTRWVPDRAAAAAALAFFADRAETVRVMPFLDGIPCSIHGFVTPTGSAVFRPIELVIFRTVDPPGFVYGGVSATWEPGETVGDEMRTVARSVAGELHRTVGYLGPFSVDGVCTADGFFPTELNPRLSPGLGVQALAVEGLGMGGVTRAIREGDLEVDHDWLERQVLAASEHSRVGGMGLPVPVVVEPATIHLRFEAGRPSVVADEEGADAVLSIGPGQIGSHLMLRFLPGRVAFGPSVAPSAVAAARLAAEVWGFDLPELEAAPDVSR